MYKARLLLLSMMNISTTALPMYKILYYLLYSKGF